MKILPILFGAKEIVVWTKMRLLVMFILFATQSYATDLNQSINEIYSDSGSSMTIKSGQEQEVPNYSDSPEELKYNAAPSTLYDDALQKSQTEETAVTVQDSVVSRPDIEVKSSDPFLQSSEAHILNAAETADFISGEYTDCDSSESQEDFNYTESRSCDYYMTKVQQQCNLKREVIVADQYNYSCSKKSKIYQKDCESVLDISCVQETVGMPKINSSSFPSKSYIYPYLSLGSGPHSLGHNCGGIAWFSGGYHWNISFEIADLERLEVFMLREIIVDDEVFYRVNGQEVYAYPNWRRDCEYGKTRTARPNFNFKPYLKEGANLIEVKLNVGGKGTLGQKFEVKYRSCLGFNEVWSEVCDAE